jgi:signal transduction histidine kinase
LGGIIFQILEDSQERMWLTSSSGVILIPRKELIDHYNAPNSALNPRLFNKSHGMPTSEITSTSKAVVAFDGKIWFPTLQGIAIVDPANIVLNKVPPPIQIEKVIANEEQFYADSIVTLKPLSRNIEIHYTALSFMSSEKNQFRYKLDGYDKEWNEVHDRRVAYYTSLPPGTYTFMLEAANNDGVWNKNHQAIRIHVQKAFWQTWGFVGLIAFSIVAITYGAVNFRIKSIKELNRKLDIKIQERTNEVLQQKEEIEAQRDYIEEKNIELEKANSIIENQYEKLQEVNDGLERKVEERTQALSLANNELDYFVYKSSHDIKGPLARLQGLTNLGLMETREDIAKRYFGLLQRESILATRVIEKLTYAHQIKNMEVGYSSFNLFDMLTKIFEQLKELHSEAESVRFILDFDKDLSLKSDESLVKEVLVSLIENAIVFQATVDQFIRVTVQVNDSTIRIRVLDNGVGINEQSRPDIFKMFFKGNEKSVGLGLGLFIAKKASETLGGSLVLKNATQWTEFEVTFPNRQM